MTPEQELINNDLASLRARLHGLVHYGTEDHPGEITPVMRASLEIALYSVRRACAEFVKEVSTPDCKVIHEP